MTEQLKQDILLVADWMGVSGGGLPIVTYYNPSQDWNQLMDIVEKIHLEQHEIIITISYGVSACNIMRSPVFMSGFTTKEATFQACVEYIKTLKK